MKMSYLYVFVVLFLMGNVSADIYMHNPRGSNNRNCETNDNRQNGNRLFDSQNNDAGGYACPRAMPFDCYKYQGDNAAKAACNNKNQGDSSDITVSNSPPNNLAQVEGRDATKDPDYVPMERMYYVAGSVLPLEWTAQHSCGPNSKVHCDIIVQVGCEDRSGDINSQINTIKQRAGLTSFSDDCGGGGKVCGPRDGTPTQNNDNNNPQLEETATTTIPDNASDQDDYRYGRHETFRNYERCKHLSRNKGLFIADQDLNGNDARYSRQNPNGDANNNRNGLECPEESEYYPYWGPSAWMDLAVLTSDVSKCAMYESESQNVKAKGYCDCTEAALQHCGASDNANSQQKIPITKQLCENPQIQGMVAGVWVSAPARDLPPPVCQQGQFSRDNHLGNVQGDGYAANFNWTVPEWLANYDSCTLRVRYNISTGDALDISVNGNQTFNGDNSPIIDRDEREELSYRTVLGSKLGIAINSDQIGRTFQDRSYMFSVKPRTEETAGACENSGTIYNMNVRGKRGNIVQVYPSVEYDFVPNKATIKDNDCLHVQWTGSDYNPNRNPNNGEGGPPDPTNENEARSDRHNILPMVSATDTVGSLDIYPTNWNAGDDKGSWGMLDLTREEWKTNLVYAKQPLDDPNVCQTFQQISNRAGNNNRQDRERDFANCAKINGAKSPYMDAGVIKAGTPGNYAFMSSRNNNFSNRQQKAYLNIENSTTVGGVLGTIVGVVAGIGAVGAAAVFAMNNMGAAKAGAAWQQHSSPAGPELTAVGVGGAAAGTGQVRAMYDHEAKEPGELTFKKGDFITVTEKDKSGWWTGCTTNGETGVFPANYVKA